MQFKEHKWVYITIIVVLIVLAVIGVARYQQKQSTAAAEQKAAQLVTALKANGFQIKDEQRAQDFVVATFGEDGGDVLAHPTVAYLRALNAAQLGSAGAASRPLILDKRLFLAEELALQIYRPDKLAQFQQYVNDMKFADTLGD
jgi:hypothetical protein